MWATNTSWSLVCLKLSRKCRQISVMPLMTWKKKNAGNSLWLMEKMILLLSTPSKTTLFCYFSDLKVVSWDRFFGTHLIAIQQYSSWCVMAHWPDWPDLNWFVIDPEGACKQFGYIHIPQSFLILWKLIVDANNPVCVCVFFPTTPLLYCIIHSNQWLSYHQYRPA